MKQMLRELKDKNLNDSARVSSKDNFELVYMRHRYFRKSTNPTNERLLSFKEMSDNIAGRVFSKNIKVFKTVGFEVEDLCSIAQIHTISFLSMSGLKENPDKMESFIEKHKKKEGLTSVPKEKDIFMFESYSMSAFLNQRLNELVRFCKNKLQNIEGTKNSRHYYVGPAYLDPNDEDLLQDFEKLGFTKTTDKNFIKTRTQNSPSNKDNFVDKDSGNRFRAIYRQSSHLTEEDFDCTPLDISLNSYYMNPEDLMILNGK
jgi:hypothetical protein